MRDNEFTVHIKDLENGPVTLQVDTTPKKLDLEDPDYTFSGIKGTVEFSQVRPRVIARGVLETRATTSCVRCLQETVIEVAASVDAAYEDEKQIKHSRNDIITPEEQIITPFNGNWIQPETELREAILLDLPALPVCKPDCKGLCPYCGTNLNEADCNCDKSGMEISSWKNALQGLKLKDDTGAGE